MGHFPFPAFVTSVAYRLVVDSEVIAMSDRVRSDSSRSSSTQDSGTRPIWIAVGLLIGIGVVVPLLVGIYDSETPRLAGFPFFFWYQFMLIPAVSALTYLAFRLAQAATARDRRSRGLPARPGEPEEDRR